MASDKQYRAKHEHRSGFTLVVDKLAENRGDADGKKGENREDGCRGLAHITHHTVPHKSHNRYSQGRVTYNLILGEIACKGRRGNHQHNDILEDSHSVSSPERGLVGRGQSQVALKHVDGILLEGENR